METAAVGCWSSTAVHGADTSCGEGSCGGGDDTEVEPTEPGSLKPWVLSSGWSKKLRLNSEPASNETSAFSFSGGGALPRFALNDWSILKTSMARHNPPSSWHNTWFPTHRYTEAPRIATAVGVQWPRDGSGGHRLNLPT